MASSWARDEIASADLGDDRLNARAAVLLSTLGNRPHLSIPAACRGKAEMQAAYRFFDNDKVTFDAVLAPHIDRTLERMSGQQRVVLVQDTSEIDLTRPEQDVVGVGELDGPRKGILLHEMQAYTPDGTALGTVWAECLNRTQGVSHAKAAHKQRRRKHMPIEEKESSRWVRGVRAARRVAAVLPGVECVCVADSEADIYEVFAEPRWEVEGGPAVDWVIRACQDRALETEHGRLRDSTLATPVLYEVELSIRGREPKTAVEDRARRGARQARELKAEVRSATLTLRPPWRPDRELPPVTVNVVLVREDNPPPGEPAVEWILVTTLPIDTLERVRAVVELYCVRWNIEILFRTLKSGCRIERRRFEHVDRILPCLAMYLIVAWRTVFVCHMSRECPDVDCQRVFEGSEWKSVWVAVHRKKPPKKNPTLREVVHLIAQLGGYVEHPTNQPGSQAVWVGLQRMYDLAWAWETFGREAKARDG